MNLEPKTKVRALPGAVVTPKSPTPTTELAWRKLALAALTRAKSTSSTRHVSALEAALRVGGHEVQRVLRQLSLVCPSDVEREFGAPSTGTPSKMVVRT